MCSTVPVLHGDTPNRYEIKLMPETHDLNKQKLADVKQRDLNKQRARPNFRSYVESDVDILGNLEGNELKIARSRTHHGNARNNQEEKCPLGFWRERNI